MRTGPNCSELHTSPPLVQQVLEASNAIAEAFEMRQEASTAHNTADQLTRETAELQSALVLQQSNRSGTVLAQTEAAQLQEAAGYYAGLARTIAECCDLPLTDTLIMQH